MSSLSRLPFRIAAFGLCLGLGTAPALAAEVGAGEVYCFSAADFTREDSALSGVCITGLPDRGQLLLGERIIRTGDILTGSQLEQLIFAPESQEEDDTALVRYLPIFDDGLAE